MVRRRHCREGGPEDVVFVGGLDETIVPDGKREMYHLQNPPRKVLS